MFKRGGVWWTCIRDNGKKIQKSLETSDEGRAKDKECLIKKELEMEKIRCEIERIWEKYFKGPVGKSKEPKTFNDMAITFTEEHAPTVAAKTRESYSASLKHLSPFFGTYDLLSISRKTIRDYKKLRMGEGAKPATINRELALLSKAFSLAIEEWEWVRDGDKPFSKMSYLKEDNERTRWLTENEEKRLLDKTPEWLGEIIVFALNTGLRQDELLSLEWSRVDLVRKTAFIQKTKNGKPKTIPLNKPALDVLENKAGENGGNIEAGLVFTGKVGLKIDRHNLRRAFNNAKDSAGIEGFTFHDLRHTFATRLTQNGVDQYKISILLGHKDAKMTQRYSHHCPESLRDGVEGLEVNYNLTAHRKEMSEVKT